MARQDPELESAGLTIACGRCSAAVPDDAIVFESGGLRASCPGCGAILERSLSGPSPADARPQVSQPKPSEAACPKCDRPVDADAAACAHCGLARSRFASFESRDEHEASATLQAMWSELSSASASDDDAHEHFLDQVALEGAFVFGARCYRTAVRERQAGAEARLERIRRMAEVALLAAPARAETSAPEPYQRLVLMLIVLVLLAGIGGIYTIFEQTSSEPEVPLPRAPIDQPVR